MIRPNSRSVGEAGHQKVLQHADAAEDFGHLKAARDTLGGERGGLAPNDRSAFEPGAALLWAIEAVEHVEEGGLARAVRSDQADQLARLDLERHLVERGQAAKAFHDAFCDQLRRHFRDRR
jgi:hypothetical protein